MSIEVKPHAYDPVPIRNYSRACCRGGFSPLSSTRSSLPIPVLFATIFIFIFGLVTFGLGWLLFWLWSPARCDLGSLLLRVHVRQPSLGHDRHAGHGSRNAHLVRRALLISCSALSHAVVFWVSVSFLTPLILLVGLFNDRRRLLHDMVVGTVVINNPAARRRRCARFGPTPHKTFDWNCLARDPNLPKVRTDDEDAVTQHSRNTPQFYLTAPSPCPYLPGQEERKVFTHLVGERAAELNDLLTHGGFRRSQSIAYRPGLRDLPRLHFGARDRRRFPADAQHAAHPRAQ